MSEMFVICPNCKKTLVRGEFTFIDVEEDMRGQDILTFTCHKCNEDGKAIVYIGAVK